MKVWKATVGSVASSQTKEETHKTWVTDPQAKAMAKSTGHSERILVVWEGQKPVRRESTPSTGAGVATEGAPAASRVRRKMGCLHCRQLWAQERQHLEIWG